MTSMLRPSPLREMDHGTFDNAGLPSNATIHFATNRDTPLARVVPLRVPDDRGPGFEYAYRVRGGRCPLRFLLDVYCPA